MKTAARSLLCAWFVLAGCGQQYAEPILARENEPACPESSVLELDGSTFASAERLIQNDFTIELWLKTAQSPSGQGFSEGTALVFADVETVQVDDFALGLLNDKVVLSVGGPDTAAVSTTSVTTNEWVHVAATRERSTGIQHVFIDGVLEGAAVGNQNSLSQAPSISIGGRASRNFLTGSMSDLRIWSLVRTQAELLAHRHERLRGDEPGLVGYYRFDDDAGDVANDSSNSRNDAVITGTSSWESSGVPLCER